MGVTVPALHVIALLYFDSSDLPCSVGHLKTQEAVSMQMAKLPDRRHDTMTPKKERKVIYNLCLC